MSFLKEFDHLKIQMKDVILATDNFNPINRIGRGGFGSVYKGELSSLSGRSMVAFKRLDRRHGQGNIEFWKEIMMLSKYKHENLVSLMHFCIEGDEMILVYDYAARGSLDRYLNDASLTWIKRLKICVEVARALHYLHDPILGTQQRLLHRDIKSSNILLDENWIAKVSDFGLSKFGPANQPQTYIFTQPVGTPGYSDPLYYETGFLTKESDVYSFGVVLFEVISGRLCYEYHDGHYEESGFLVPKWRECYEEKRLDEIIFLILKEQMDHGSLTSFVDIAYRCVKRTREERPTMVEVLKELEFAHQQQEIYENMIENVDFEQVFGVIPSSFGRLEKHLLFMFLLEGIVVDNGKTWLIINKDAEICEIISATKCVPSSDALVFATPSRFPNAIKVIKRDRVRLELKVNTQFLTPNVTYTINLVYGFAPNDNTKGVLSYGLFLYKIDDKFYLCDRISGVSVRKDGWQVTALYQFTSYQKKFDFGFEIAYIGNAYTREYFFESIEFRPMKNIEGREKIQDINRRNHLYFYSIHPKYCDSYV